MHACASLEASGMAGHGDDSNVCWCIGRPEVDALAPMTQQLLPYPHEWQRRPLAGMTHATCCDCTGESLLVTLKCVVCCKWLAAAAAYQVLLW
jgi:hypothetical protein